MGALVSAILGLLKWPLAACIAALTPAGAAAFFALVAESWSHGTWTSAFGIGFVSALFGLLVLGRMRIVRFWCTLEHEFTHALFAWITLVPVVELRSTDGSLASDDNTNGHVRLRGGNWLISIAPYFFPTASALLLVATWTLAAQPSLLARLLLGMATAYSVVSTWRETHRHQTDLSRVGFLFSWLFLPGANLLCYGMLLANEVGGPARAIRYPFEAFAVTWRWIGG